MKEKYKLVFPAAVVLVGVLFVFSQQVTAQGGEPPIAPLTETQADASRSVEGVSPNALTSAIWMSNPYCYQPDTTRNECFINLRYSQVTQDGTTAPFLYNLEINVDGKLRYNSNVFFENSIYYNYNMIPDGIKIACGSPNEGGAGTSYGKVYPVFVEAKTYTGTSMGWGSASVRCPAYVP